MVPEISAQQKDMKGYRSEMMQGHFGTSCRLTGRFNKPETFDCFASVPSTQEIFQ
jgi:hypothetical protein